MIEPPENTLIELENADGQWWTLAGEGQWDDDVCLADEDDGFDFDGMYEAPVEAIYNSTAFQVGATFGGIREDKYDFILALHVKGSRGRPWKHTDSSFRKGLSFLRDSRLWVTTTESRRHLPIRLGGKVKIKARNDPNSEQYGLLLAPIVGAHPRWMGAPDISTFITQTDTTAPVTPPETGYVTVSNPLPADYEIYVKWEIQASAAGMVVTLPDYSWGNDEYERAEEDALRRVELAPLLAGEHLLIDTDKMAFNGQFNSSLDTEFPQRMGGQRLVYPIPGGTPPTQVPVTVTGAPAGTGIRVICPRPWPRPWGLE
ncbi:phage tail protein [Nocardia cyriacigeorgica]|uniref:Phage tail protein n=1 Tax=Nocardia cyriacigeorgica TaxID=135487 RepID=A0ABX0CL02_9NOCA|nr:phage tail protein [Nocardia cyriacigeorgica]NEW40776.1 phage tail protein [Nocardia cyriacigeorgica]NEW50998.1 phage tail protein [Nocardia cyriacigeorgica]NEW54419.1 phage tail protein [Nocardia cyriacigeorgica]